MLAIDVYIAEGIDGEDVCLEFFGVVLYDAAGKQYDISNCVLGIREDPEDPTHLQFVLMFSAAAFAVLNGYLAADLKAPEGTLVFVPEYFGEYFEFVLFYDFTVLGVSTEQYYECYEMLIPND